MANNSWLVLIFQWMNGFVYRYCLLLHEVCQHASVVWNQTSDGFWWMSSAVETGSWKKQTRVSTLWVVWSCYEKDLSVITREWCTGYPVLSGIDQKLGIHPVGSGILYPVQNDIPFPVSGRILYQVLSGTLPTTAKFHRHRFLWYLIFLVSRMHPKCTLMPSQWH